LATLSALLAALATLSALLAALAALLAALAGALLPSLAGILLAALSGPLLSSLAGILSALPGLVGLRNLPFFSSIHALHSHAAHRCKNVNTKKSLFVPPDKY
jgi:hypothetical protein